MADDDVQVQFGASISGLTAGVEEVKSEIEGISAPVRSLMSAFKELGEAFLAAFAVEQIAEFIHHFAELGDKLESTAAMLGVSTDAMQELNFIAAATGTNAEGMTSAMERLQVSLQRAQVPLSTQAQALAAIGLNAKQLIGLSLDEQMNRIADAVSKFADGGNKTAIVMELLGRNGAQMIPILDKGRKGLDDLRESAHGSASVMSEETVEALSHLSTSIATFSKASQALGGTIIGTLAPAFDAFLKILTDVIANMTRSINEGGILKTTFDLIADAIRGVDIALAVAIGTVETFWEVTKTDAAIIGAAWAAVGRIMKDVFTLNWSDISGAWDDLKNKVLANAKGLADGMKTIVEQMTGQIKAALSGGGEGGEHGGKTQAPAINLNAGDALKAQINALETEIQLANAAYQQQSEHINSLAKTFQITETGKTQALLAALDARRNAEMAALAQEASLRGLSKEQYQKILDEQEKLDQKYAADRQKIMDQSFEASVKDWTSALSSLQSSWDAQLKPLLARTESWAQAMKNVLADMVLDGIKWLEKLALQQAAIGLAKGVGGGPSSLFGNLLGGGNSAAQAANTAAVSGLTAAITGQTAATATQTATDVTSDATDAANVTTTTTLVGAVVALTTAITANTAALTIGNVEHAIPGFDVGSWSIPHDMVAMVHQGEAIIPNNGLADAFRAGALGGGGGGVMFNVSAIDGASVQRFFQQNGLQLARVLQGTRTLNPSTG